MKLTITADELNIDLSKLSLERFQKIAEQQVVETITRIDANLSKGLDADGGSLKGYAKSTLEKKKKELGTTVVNLTETGQLRNSRRAVRKIPGGAESRFIGNHSTKGNSSLPNAKLAGYLHDKGFTGWHQFGAEDLKRIQDRFSAEVGKALKEAVSVKKAGL
jgi:hypothetical protein